MNQCLMALRDFLSSQKFPRGCAIKWFKHMTASWDDERLARLVGSGGMEGLAMYGLYWRLLEIVAAQMDGKTPSCSVQYPVTRWSLLLSLRGSHVFSTLSRLAVTGVVTLERHDTDVRVTIPNLLKYRDEYARKSGHTPDNIPPRTEGEGEGEGEQNKKEKKNKLLTRSVPPEELAGTLPLVDGTEYLISKSQIREWTEAYPGVNIRTELLGFKAWLNANPTRKKTSKGICRAIIHWLSGAQNKSYGTPNKGVVNGKTDRAVEIATKLFNEFENNVGANGSELLPGG